jgi:hypothetical protein
MTLIRLKQVSFIKFGQIQAQKAVQHFFAYAMLLVLVSACATLKPENTDKWRDSQSKVVSERASARWATLMKGDLETAYSYTSPDYRAVVTLQQYKGRIGSIVEWKLARVKDVSYDEPTVASVKMEVTYRYRMRSAGEVESVQILDEKWLYKDGNWWYTSK